MNQPIIKLKQSLEQKIAQVELLYGQMEQAFKLYQQSAQLPCLDKCGACCLSPGVEATVLEALPAALDLFKQNKHNEVYEALEKLSDPICVFYTRISADGQQGYCGNYQFRPAICRMFGVHARMNKAGRPELGACKLIKGAFAKQWQSMQEQPGDLEPVLMAKWQSELNHIDHHLSQEKMPINLAFKKALEYIYLQVSYETEA